jgi:hypothetical protein
MAVKIAKRSISARALQKEAERAMGDGLERIWEAFKP